MKPNPTAMIGIAAAGLLLFSAAPQAQETGHPIPDMPLGHSGMHHHSGGSPHGHAGHEQLQADHADVSVSLKLPPGGLHAEERSQLVFSLEGSDGKPLQDLVEHHARMLHVVIVSEDMQVFGHVHPEDFGESVSAGETRVFFSFPQGGRYLVAADLVTDDGPHAAQFTVDVEGEEAVAQAPDTAAALSYRSFDLEDEDRYTAPVLMPEAQQDEGEYGVSLLKPAAVRAGEEVTLTYRLTRDGASVTELRPYLDAAMHVAVVKDDLTTFLHEHGTAPGVSHINGHGHGHHRDRGDATAASFGPQIAVTLSFPEPGRYHLFGQNVHGDEIIVSRFAVDVEK